MDVLSPPMHDLAIPPSPQSRSSANGTCRSSHRLIIFEYLLTQRICDAVVLIVIVTLCVCGGVAIVIITLYCWRRSSKASHDVNEVVVATHQDLAPHNRVGCMRRLCTRRTTEAVIDPEEAMRRRVIPTPSPYAIPRSLPNARSGQPFVGSVDPQPFRWVTPPFCVVLLLHVSC